MLIWGSRTSSKGELRLARSERVDDEARSLARAFVAEQEVAPDTKEVFVALLLAAEGVFFWFLAQGGAGGFGVVAGLEGVGEGAQVGADSIFKRDFEDEVLAGDEAAVGVEVDLVEEIRPL